jgi:eukaryotic-like serine/threonine-protein kinase
MMSAGNGDRREAGAGRRPIPVLAPGSSIRPGLEVIAHLRRGNDLDVYDAWDVERDCRCVAKVLRPDRARRPRSRRRLRLEGQRLLGIAHPHIVRAYELIERPDPVLVLETLDGQTLEHMVATRSRRLATGDVAYLGLHLCSAVQYLHRRGILHLDLKPSNVICDRGQAKLIDLSVARPPGRVPAGVGTRQYLAPEQARGGELGPPTDVWGIGEVLFEALTGCRPFPDGVGVDANGRRHVAPPVPRIAGHARRLPPALRRGIEACLDPDPPARPGVTELSTILDQVALAGLPADDSD